MKDQLKQLYRRVLLMINRAVVKRVRDNQGFQRMQLSLMADEIAENYERFQNYGFTTVPPIGSEAVVACVGGSRNHGLVIAVDNRKFRLKNLQSGEIALYTDEGDCLHFKRNNEISIKTNKLSIDATTEVTINSPILKVSGDIVDNTSGNAVTMQAMRATFNSHTHVENGSAGPTNPPTQQMA